MHNIPSPFYQKKVTEKQKILAALDTLEIPMPSSIGKNTPCHRDCHLVERHSTLSLVRDLVKKTL